MSHVNSTLMLGASKMPIFYSGVDYWSLKLKLKGNAKGGLDLRNLCFLACALFVVLMILVRAWVIIRLAWVLVTFLHSQ